MSEILELSVQTVVTSISDTDRVYIESGGQLKPIAFSALAKAVRDTVHIGGRNLLKETASFVVSTSDIKWIKSKCVLTGPECMGQLPMTFSCKYRKTGEIARNFGIGASRASNWYDQKLISPSNAVEAGSIAITFSPSSAATSFSPFVQGSAGVELYDFKLERGNMATDWTPAPEDLMSQSGGVIYCPLNPYIVLLVQKGGRHERGNGTHQYCLEGNYVRRDDVSSKRAYRLRHSYSDRRLFGQRLEDCQRIHPKLHIWNNSSNRRLPSECRQMCATRSVSIIRNYQVPDALVGRLDCMEDNYALVVRRKEGVAA